MTIAEIGRAVASRARVEKHRAQERATYDYLLADLIGKSISRIYSSSARYPDIGTVYPTLFDSEEIQEQKKIKQAELSAARFKQFADTFNKKFKEVADIKND